jgi:hypothetical protein
MTDDGSAADRWEGKIKGWTNEFILPDGGSINSDQANEVKAKYGVFPRVSGLRKGQAKRLGFSPDTKASAMSLDGVLDNFKEAKQMTLDFVASNGKAGAKAPPGQQAQLRLSQAEQKKMRKEAKAAAHEVFIAKARPPSNIPWDGLPP